MPTPPTKDDFNRWYAHIIWEICKDILSCPGFKTDERKQKQVASDLRGAANIIDPEV